jgi:PilZ domain
MRSITRSIERRSKTRFPMQREVRYKLLEGDRIIASGTGTTCNMSSSGVAFTCDRPLPMGGFIELSISWPVLLDNGCPMRLIVFGKVLRTGMNRSVCTVEKHEFRTQARTLQFTAPPRVDGTLLRWAKEYTKAQQASA